MTEENNEPISIICVWPDYQPIRADMELHPLVRSTLDRVRDLLMHYGISRITLINDVVYPSTNMARDVLKFEPADINKLSDDDKAGFFSVAETMAELLKLDPQVPSKAVMWNNDIYILMSTCAAVLTNKRI